MISTLNLIIAIISFYFGDSIYHGNTNLILFYKTERVINKQSYTKNLGKALYLISFTSLTASLVSLISTDLVSKPALLILILGIITGLILIIINNKKNLRKRH